MLTGLTYGIRHIRHAEEMPTHPLSPRMMTLSRVRLREAMAPKPLDLADKRCNLGHSGGEGVDAVRCSLTLRSMCGSCVQTR
jgi:hypothetical protein